MSAVKPGRRVSMAVTPASVAAGGSGKWLKFKLPKCSKEESNTSTGSLLTNMPTIVQRQAETNLKNTGFLLIICRSSRLGPFHFVSMNPPSKFMI